MSTHVYTAGARTRNVVNIANPGGTSAAYSLTAANSNPSAATDGFKNFHSQKTLHVLIHNNGLVDGSAGALSIAAEKVQVWVYNSSLGGVWSKLRIPMRDVRYASNNLQDGTALLEFLSVENPAAITKDSSFRMIVPIEGAERIAIRLKGSPFSGTRAAGSCDIYLGVNTIK